MTNPMDMMQNDLEARLVLELADDKLLLGHIQSDWTGLGPILEEDIAASSMAQDDLSHALVLYEYLGARFNLDPDVIAYEREPTGYRCCDLVTVPDEFDWATAFVRRWLFAHYAAPALDRLGHFENGDLVERTRRLRAEETLHIVYLNDWMQRLGSGPLESRDRIQTALDVLAPHAGMLFEQREMNSEIGNSIDVGCEELFDEWSTAINTVLSSTDLTASITLPENKTRGGRNGKHADHFLAQWTEMNEVRSTDPGAAW